MCILLLCTKTTEDRRQRNDSVEGQGLLKCKGITDDCWWKTKTKVANARTSDGPRTELYPFWPNTIFIYIYVFTSCMCIYIHHVYICFFEYLYLNLNLYIYLDTYKCMYVFKCMWSRFAVRYHRPPMVWFQNLRLPTFRHENVYLQCLLHGGWLARSTILQIRRIYATNLTKTLLFAGFMQPFYNRSICNASASTSWGSVIPPPSMSSYHVIL